jgi:uncharacterized protein involved in exopolysaccharide biosynthesis
MGIHLDDRESPPARRPPEAPPTSPAEDAGRMLAAIRRRWLVAANALFATLIAAFVFSHLGAPRYEATAQYFSAAQTTRSTSPVVGRTSGHSITT